MHSIMISTKNHPVRNMPKENSPSNFVKILHVFRRRQQKVSNSAHKWHSVTYFYELIKRMNFDGRPNWFNSQLSAIGFNLTISTYQTQGYDKV